MKRLALVTTAAALAAGACRTASNEESRGVSAAGPVWTETVELRLDEVFVADGRGLEVRPVSVETQRATLLVRARGLVMSFVLHAGPGPLSSHTVYPYRLELLSTTIQPSVRLQVSRLR